MTTSFNSEAAMTNMSNTTRRALLKQGTALALARTA